jgi:hypothetical protein
MSHKKKSTCGIFHLQKLYNLQQTVIHLKKYLLHLWTSNEPRKCISNYAATMKQNSF